MKADTLSRLAREAPEMEPYVDYLRRAEAGGEPSLAGSFVSSAGHHLVFEKALCDIDDAFREAGIEFLVLKGMALGYLVYPDPATRPMTDIDLLVRPGDVARAAERIERLGYRSLKHQDGFTDDLMRFGGELKFDRTPEPSLELHWMLEQYERLRGVIRIDEEALWRRAMPYAMAGRTLRTPSPEDQMLTLAIHLGLVHRMRGLRWLLDIDLVVRTFAGKINWPVTRERARAWGIERLLRHTLWSCREAFGTPVPKELALRPVAGAGTPLGPLLLIDRTSDRVQVVWRALFPSREWLRYRYRHHGTQRVWLRRLVHPLRVLTGRFE